MKRITKAVLLGSAMLAPALAVPTGAAYAQTATRQYAIAAQDLGDALRQFARQSGRDVVFDPALTRGKTSKAVQGALNAEAALKAMLEGSGLVYTTTSAGFAVRSAGGNGGGGEGGGYNASSWGEHAVPEGLEGISEILVVGSRSQNVDIRRTEDDAQPYVTFSAKDISQSGSTNIEDFLKTRLPMNAAVATLAQQAPQTGAVMRGQFNLRGLGPSQTLVLVDGRRIPNVGTEATEGFGQPLISGIPITAIERIEVLPTTAGGIYGGSATGGVINIVLKRDYSGLDIQTTYSDAFDGRATQGDIAVSGGYTLNKGRTRLMFNLHHAEREELLQTDRHFARASTALLAQNAPSFIVPGFSPIIGLTPNFCSIATPTSISCGTGSLTLDTGANLGSSFAYVPVEYSGSPEGGAAFIQTAGRYNFDPAINAGTLLAGGESNSASLTTRHRFSKSIEAYADVAVDDVVDTGTSANSATVNLAAAAPNNPFQQNVRVNIPLASFPSLARREIQSTRARAGVIVRLPANWSASLEYSAGRTVTKNVRRDILITPVSPAATSYLQSIALSDPNSLPLDRSQFVFGTASSGPFESSLEDISLRYSGPVFRLPGGPITLSGLAEGRKELLDASFAQSAFQSVTGAATWFPRKRQEITSYYAELRAPLLSPHNLVNFAHTLELMASIRRDEYETTGPSGATFFTLPNRSDARSDVDYVTNSFNSTDYTLGLRYMPSPDLTIRASYGTGFLPPNMGQISPRFSTSPPSSTILLNLLDPRRGNTLVTGSLDRVSGGNEGLMPETSKSLSVGVVFTPGFIAGLRISADYTSIQKSDEIITPALQYLIDNESKFAGRIARAANTPGDPAGWAGPIIGIDNSVVNLTGTKVKAFDFQVDYDLPTKTLGDWHVYAVATHQTALKRQFNSTMQPIDSVGFSDGPLSWRANVGITWAFGSWTTGWNAQFYDDYLVYASSAPTAQIPTFTMIQGSAKIRSQTYHDLFVRHIFEDRLGSIFRGMELGVGVQNVLGQRPRIIAAQGYSTYADPRLRRFTLTLRRSLGGRN